jgi:hypothetical protein
MGTFCFGDLTGAPSRRPFHPMLVHWDDGEACAAICSKDSVDGFGESLGRGPKLNPALNKPARFAAVMLRCAKKETLF